MEKTTIMKRFIVTSIALMFFFVLTGFAQIKSNEQTKVNILVVAINGVEITTVEWQSITDYLQSSLPQYEFKMIFIAPIELPRIKELVASQEIDFVITQPAIYADLDLNFGISCILTMVKKGGLSEFGSTLITRSDSGIKTIEDLHGKTIGGVAKLSFDGWLVGYKEMLTHGFDPYKDAKKVKFFGEQLKAIHAVLDGVVDVAVIRTGILEKLSESNQISLDDFRVLAPKKYPGFSLLVSSELYPEWAFARTRNSSNELSKAVALSLLSLGKNSLPAQKAEFQKWTFPYDYQPVHELLKELHVGPYKDYGKVTIRSFIIQHTTEAVIIIAFLTLILLMTVKIYISNMTLSKEITVRKQVQEKLSEKSMYLDNILRNSTGYAIITTDIDLRITYYNPMAEQFFGYLAENTIGKTVYEMHIQEHVDQERLEKAIEIVRTQGEYKYTVIQETGNGVRYLDSRVTDIRNLDGEMVGFALFSENITKKKQAEDALRKSEQRFRELFNSTTDLIYTRDMAGRLTSTNPAMQKLFGYDGHEFIGRTETDFMESENQSNVGHQNLDIIKKQGYIEGIDCYLKKNGEKLYIDYKSFVVEPVNGKPYISGIARDISEKILSEKKLKKLQEQIQQTQKMESIGTLAGGIAHDFNNILFPVLGHTEMLMHDIPDDDPIHKKLEKIYSGANRAKELVKQILTFSRQEKSELKLVRLQPVIKEVLKLVRATIPTTISIKHDIRSDCGIIKADPTQIHQIIMNLTANSYHAMEESGGNLQVTLKEVNFTEHDLINPDMIPGKFACLTVADTGAGIKNELTDKIFDPFFTTKEVGKGTGMGLSVVHGIVKSMNGIINVYSEADKGTEFNVYFPLEESSYEKQKIQTNKALQTGIEHILFVDDEKAVIEIEQDMLERLGYKVTSCSSSLEALKAFRASSDKFDIVITDMQMPNMSGDKLASELTKIRPDIPVLLCTGFSETMSEDKAAAKGIKGFLLKPIVMKDLAQKIREVLDEKTHKQ